MARIYRSKVNIGLRFVHSQIGSKEGTKIMLKHQSFLGSVLPNGMNDEGSILAKYDSNVCEIVINNPLKRNAINGKMMNDLARIHDELITQLPLAIIIRGQGDYFCSGADLTLSINQVNDSERGMQMASFMTDLLTSLRQMSIISVCMINGPALGGGAELTTACDFRIMNNSAFLQFVHARIGASPGWGGGSRLLQIVGRQKALKILGTSCKIDSNYASQIGLTDIVYNQPSVSESSASVQNDAISQPGLLFLKPFLDQPYASSLRGIKSIIAYSDKNPSFYEMQEYEKKIFGELWCGKDNKHAIDNILKHKNKSK